MCIGMCIGLISQTCHMALYLVLFVLVLSPGQFKYL